jgi:signal transduction histidine kinase
VKPRHRFRAARHRWRHSLKWRLVTLFLLLALATTAVFLFGMQRVLQGGWQGYAKPLVADYVDKLAAEIGSPPDEARAKAIVARLPVSIRIDGPQVRYDSHPGATYPSRTHPPPPVRPEVSKGQSEPALRKAQDDRNTELRSEHELGAEGWGLSRTTADGHRILFGLAGPPPDARPRSVGWATLAALLLLTGLAFAFVRRLLRPLDDIGAGVARFGSGEFEPLIRVRRRDELGDLAERINRMAQSLHGKLDAKRALLLAISHELRSPLTRARVNAELVEEGEHRSALLRDLGEMRDLITELLESERLATGHAALHTEAVDLPALVRELVAAQWPDAGLTLQLDDRIGPVRVDPMRVRLLLRNLIDNALRHSAGAPTPPVVSLSRDAEGQLNLSVREFGPGVAEEHLAHLAEPFYRVDSARQRATGGFGLGLYLSQLVAQAHGGELHIRRAEPGLKVTATWPVDRGDAMPSSTIQPKRDVPNKIH